MKPPGIVCVLDDMCAQLHAQGDGADQKFLEKLQGSFPSHPHLAFNSTGFMIIHYAGEVRYEVDGFCERNRDVLFPDIVQLIQSSSVPFLVFLFPEDTSTTDKHGRQKKALTAGGKITSQANLLVDKLMRATPHYLRCMKPNENKKVFAVLPPPADYGK